jgi:hypothetical protein
MKTNSILSKAGVLLLAAVFILSSTAVMADTHKNTPLAAEDAEVVLGNMGTLPRDEEEIKYYNPDTLTHVIGLSGGTPPYYWYSAVRFTQEELLPYAGWDLVRVLVTLSCDNGQTEVYANMTIWEGGTATAPGSIIYEDNGLYFDATGFYEIELTTPIALDDIDEQLWIGFEWEQTEEGAFIPFTDDGPAVAGKGDLVSQNGGASFGTLSGYGLDYNWGMGAIVSGTGKAELAIQNVAGPIGVSADVKNIGEGPATDVEYTMTVQGGILGRIDKSASGTAAELAPNGVATVSSGIIFGLGKITIEVTANAANAVEVTETFSGTVIGPLVIGLG